LATRRVYLGNKLFTRRVWNLHRDAEGRVFGFAKLPSQGVVKVWLNGDLDHGNWTTIRG